MNYSVCAEKCGGFPPTVAITTAVIFPGDLVSDKEIKRHLLLFLSVQQALGPSVHESSVQFSVKEFYGKMPYNFSVAC
jgi:hypothetical protein